MTSTEAAELARQGIDLAKQGLQDNRLLDERLKQLAAELDQYELLKLRERIAVLEAHVADLKKSKDEADKRQWQFVYIFAGAMASLLVTVVVQLVLAMVRKP